jgi:hypothetical protein
MVYRTWRLAWDGGSVGDYGYQSAQLPPSSPSDGKYDFSNNLATDLHHFHHSCEAVLYLSESITYSIYLIITGGYFDVLCLA